jgi:hypothetical protein
MLTFWVSLIKRSLRIQPIPMHVRFACVTSSCSPCWRSVGRATGCQTLSAFRYIWWPSWTALQKRGSSIILNFGNTDSVCVCVCGLLLLLTFSMLHYMVTLHALRLSICNMVTCIYNLYTVSSGFCRHNKFTFGFLIYYLLLWSSVYCIIN